jgi:glycosyltransferase involved in cell wall biosynthesis
LNKKKIIYWSPHLTNIGTINSVLNSIKSLKKFSNNTLQIEVLNLFGEWENHRNYLKNLQVDIINLLNPKINKYIPKHSFLKSRFSYIFFFIISFYSLRNYLEKNKNNVLIIHLLTSLPLMVIKIFNLDVKIILRISGRIKKNYLRLLIWKICKNKVKLITCPSNATRDDMIKLNIFDQNRIITLLDPILEPKLINKLKNENLENKKLIDSKYFIAVGRLTKQKNFSYLIKSFSNFHKKYPEYLLVILGEGEERLNLLKLINLLKLEEKIYLLGYQKNVYNFLNHSQLFVSTSLYEDPGATIIQSIYCNKFVISSNCKNGPAEILLNGDGGILVNEKKENLESAFNKYLSLSKTQKEKIMIKAKKNIINYSTFRHYKKLNKIISEI